METIGKRLARAAEYVQSLGYCPAYISLYGSQNYGLSAYAGGYHSDFDFKCIVLPSLMDLTQERDYASLTVEFEDGLIDIKDVRLFAKLIERMNPAYLECLMSNHYLVLDGGAPIEEMRSLLPELFIRQGTGFAHVCRKLFEEKQKRMCHRSPAQAENIDRYGYDLKQAHHMYRLLVTMREFERTGMMQLVPPQEERVMLLDLKYGKYSLEDVQRLTVDWHAELTAIEARIAEARGKDKILRKIKRLVQQAVYEHCRKEVLQDGNLPG